MKQGVGRDAGQDDGRKKRTVTTHSLGGPEIVVGAGDVGGVVAAEMVPAREVRVVHARHQLGIAHLVLLAGEQEEAGRRVSATRYRNEVCAPRPSSL